MNTYVRVSDGVVVEIVKSDIAISQLFHPDAGFMTASDEISIGWHFVDGKFYPPKIDLALEISQVKTAKLDEINKQSQAFVDSVTGAASTPEFERATWLTQGQEAEAWHADNTAPTPNLDSIAERRGVPVEVLRQKAYEKSVAYKALTSAVAGQRQRYEDTLNAATTVDEVEKIVVKYAI